MGNSIIVKRIKGITQYYAKDHMSQYKKGDFLRIVPEFDNPYDHNALAIYDDYNHKLGFIDKYSNVEVYQTIKDVDYVCIITSVYIDYSKPSIEFEIIYRTSGSRESISNSLFNEYLSKYNRNSTSSSNNNKTNQNQGTSQNNLSSLLSLLQGMSNSDEEKPNFNRKIEMYSSTNIDADSAIDEAIEYMDDEDYDSAIDVLSDFENEDNADVFYFLGTAHYERNDDSDDIDDAKYYLEKSLEAGRDDAIIALGNIHLELEEYVEAFECYKKAAAQKMVYSYNNLGHCYANGYGTPKNLRLAFIYFQMAAKEGISEAQFNLGSAYELGSGTPVSFRKAFEWYSKAAEQDNADAIYNIGTFYYNGRYVDQDYDKALEQFNKVIELQPNDAQAHDFIGLVYYQKHQLDTAISWFKKAFNLGFEHSSYKLGLVYNELGKQNEARKWFVKAKDLGIEEAKQYL